MTHADTHHTSAHSVDTAAVLRAGGFRVTATRQNLLTLLNRRGVPVSIEDIKDHWSGKIPDTATLYRSLTDLHAAGIVRRVELGTGRVHYEYTPSRPHHHHIVCNTCGRVEEFEYCALVHAEKSILRESTQFNSIHSHNLEFFGSCVICEAKK